MRMMTTLHTSTLTPERTSYATTPEAAMSTTTVPPKSPWHSPVPYLFGGLAAMLGLIAFALLILACSYWKLSRDDTQRRHHHNDDDEGSGDLESGGLKGDGLSKVNGVPIFEEKIVVIMAGNDKPTFLAKPAKMLNCKCNSNDDDDDKDGHAMVNTTIAKNDGANKESSSVANDDDGHHHDDHHDGDDDDDDDKPKEDEATTHHPHTSN